METGTTAATKPAVTKNGQDNNSIGQELSDLLSRGDFGARVSGIVLKVEEPRTFEGKNDNGTPYVSHSRRMEVFAGAAGSVVCGERCKSLADFAPIRLGSVVSWRIVGAKTEGKQMVFRVETQG